MARPSSLPADQRKPLQDVKKLNIEVLDKIVRSTHAGHIYYATISDVQDLMNKGLVEKRNDTEERNGMIPVQATGDGMAYKTESAGAVTPTKQAIPTAHLEADEDKYPIVDDVLSSGDDAHTEYPFGELEVGQGFFIENTSTMDGSNEKLLESVYKAIYEAKLLFAEIDRDENGDEILEHLTVKVRATNPDGTYKRESDGKIETGANFIQRPRYIYTRHFTVKAVDEGMQVGEGWKAPGKGVFVTREL